MTTTRQPGEKRISIKSNGLVYCAFILVFSLTSASGRVYADCLAVDTRNSETLREKSAEVQSMMTGALNYRGATIDSDCNSSYYLIAVELDEKIVLHLRGPMGNHRAVGSLSEFPELLDDLARQGVWKTAPESEVTSNVKFAQAGAGKGQKKDVKPVSLAGSYFQVEAGPTLVNIKGLESEMLQGYSVGYRKQFDVVGMAVKYSRHENSPEKNKVRQQSLGIDAFYFVLLHPVVSFYSGMGVSLSQTMIHSKRIDGRGLGADVITGLEFPGGSDLSVHIESVFTQAIYSLNAKGASSESTSAKFNSFKLGLSFKI